MILTLMGLDMQFMEYEKLKTASTSSIKREDLPDEFSIEAFRTVDEFIRKTKNMELECVMYFDYITGEILKFAMGEIDNVSIDFEEGEFENHHVASIYNHPKGVFSPPSGKNFGILLREFEKYELIVSFDNFWILKAKLVDEKLNLDLKIYSDLIFESCFDFAKRKYDDVEKANDICEIMYGVMLLNYINDKNINDIQLTKKEYITMPIESINQTARYNCRKKITDPEEIRKIEERIADPYTLTGIDKLRVFHEMMGLEFDENIFEKIIEEYGLDD